MPKSLCIASAGVLLLAATTVRGVEVPERAKVEISGPIRIEIQTETKSLPGQPVQQLPRLLINGQPLELPAGDGAIRLEGPVQIEVPGIELPGGASGILGQTLINDLPAKWRGGMITIGPLGPEPGKYWLGVACGLPDDGLRAKLRAKLDLPEDEGIVVENVVPDSPAAKVGIKAGDVLLKAGDKPLKKLQDLIEVVQQSGGKQLTLEVLREDKQETIALVPETRPAAYQLGVPGLPMPMPGNPDWERIRKWIEEMQAGQQGKEEQKGKQGQGGLNFSFVRPGIILRGSASMESALPDDMTVTISKTGQQPLQVTVKQGDQTWEASETGLDKLPEKARSYVERMLSRTSGVSVRVVGEPNKPPRADTAVVPPAAGVGVEKRLEEMGQRIEALGKLIERLQPNGPQPQAAPQPQREKASFENPENTREHNEQAPPKEL